MIHDEAVQPLRTVLLWGIASHLEVGLMQAGQAGLSLKNPGVEFNHVLSKKSTTQCPNR
jgi:hypothetical protein